MVRVFHTRIGMVLLCLCQLEAAGAGGSGSFGIIRRLFVDPDMANSTATVPRIKIGTPVTFSATFQEKRMQNSYELFLSSYVDTYKGVLVNGTRHAVELVLVDDGGTPSGAELAAQYLVREEGIRHFLGPRDGLEINDKVSQVVHAAGGVQVLPGSKSPSVFRGRPGVFGTLTTQRPEDGQILAMLGAADNHTRKTLAYLGFLNAQQRQRLASLAAASNIDLVKVVPVRLQGSWQQTMTKALTLARRSNPDILMTGDFKVAPCVGLLASLREAGLQEDYSPKALILWGCSGLDTRPAFSKHATGIILVNEWRRYLPFTGTLTGTWTPASFVSAYTQRYGGVPQWGGAAAFVAAATLVHGIEGARSPSPQHVIHTLKAVRADSIFGTIRFDRNGQSAAPLPAMLFLGSEMELLAPCAQCQGTLRYPKPSYRDMECNDRRKLYETVYGYIGGVCQVCPSGRVSSKIVNSAGGVVRRVCRPCPRGKFSANVTATSNASVTMCVGCNPGSFSDAEGAKQCKSCPVGHFTNRSGETACSPCDAGHFARQRGQDRCIRCEPGTYQNMTASPSCIRCAEGTYSQTLGATACDACLDGLATKGAGSSSSSDCGCPAGSFDTSAWDAAAARRCEPCPEGISSMGFGAPLELAPGYYEAAGDFNPTRGVWRCASERACPGGAPGTCRGGLEGIACSLCPEGQAKAADRCANCHRSNAAFPVLLGVGGPIFIIAYYYLAAPDFVDKRTPVKLGIAIMVGVTVTVIQVLGMLFQLNIRWPEQVRPIFEACSTALGDGDTFGFPCVLGREPENTYIFVCLVPFVVVALFILMVLASRLLPALTRRRLQAWPYVEAFNALGGLGQVSFIVLAAQAAVAVQCYTHPNGRQTMLKYPSIICFESGTHMHIVGFGGLLLCCFVLPFMAISLWGSYSTYVSALHTGVKAPQLIMYRFLFYRYRPMVWWWGSIFNARQLLLGLTPVITPNDPGMQVTIVLLVLLIYLMLLLNFYPWRSFEINFLDVAITSFMSCIMIAVSNLVPASSFEARHWGLLLASVALTLITVGIAIVHTLASLVRRGCSGEYGVRFPKEASLDRFATSWVKLIRRLSEVSDDSHLHMLQELDDFDRRSIDKVICIISSMFDIEQRQSWHSSRFSDWKPACKVLRTAAGSFQGTTRVSSRSLSARAFASDAPEGERSSWSCQTEPSVPSFLSERSAQGEAASEAAPQLLGRAEPQEDEEEEEDKCRQEPAARQEAAPEAPATAADRRALSRRTSKLCQQLGAATAELLSCVDALGSAEDPEGRAAVSEAFRTMAFLEEEIQCKTKHCSL